MSEPGFQIFSIHCFFAKQKSKRMVRTGGEVMGGIASARLDDVQCQVSLEIMC